MKNDLKKLFTACVVIGILILPAAPVFSAEEMPALNAELRHLDTLVYMFNSLKHRVATMPVYTTSVEVEKVSYELLQTLKQLNELYGDTGKNLFDEKLLEQLNLRERY